MNKPGFPAPAALRANKGRTPNEKALRLGAGLKTSFLHIITIYKICSSID